VIGHWRDPSSDLFAVGVLVVHPFAVIGAAWAQARAAALAVSSSAPVPTWLSLLSSSAVSSPLLLYRGAQINTRRVFTPTAFASQICYEGAPLNGRQQRAGDGVQLAVILLVFSPTPTCTSSWPL
jgi:hypothetical protein